MTGSLKDLQAGLLGHPGRALASAFIAFSVLWTITEALSHLVPGVELRGAYVFALFCIGSVAFGGFRVWKPSRIGIKIAHSNTCVEVLFGDLFLQKGIKAIAVTEFFDSEIGRPVAESSLHGIFLKKCFGGHPEPFDNQVNDQLKAFTGEDVGKIEGKRRRFPIGTTALVNVDKEKYIVFALSEVDPESCKARADVTMMWVALNQLWQRARIECGGEPLNLPLIGSGLSGIGLPTRDLLNLIILSAITESKAKPIAPRIRIVLHRNRFDEVDLREVKKHWEE